MFVTIKYKQCMRWCSFGVRIKQTLYFTFLSPASDPRRGHYADVGIMLTRGGTRLYSEFRGTVGSSVEFYMARTIPHSSMEFGVGIRNSEFWNSRSFRYPAKIIRNHKWFIKRSPRGYKKPFTVCTLIIIKYGGTYMFWVYKEGTNQIIGVPSQSSP